MRCKKDKKGSRYGRVSEKRGEDRGTEDLMKLDNRHVEETKLKCSTGVGDGQRMRSWASRRPRWHNSG